MADLVTMNVRVKVRLIALATAIGLMGLLIVFMTVRSQQQAGQLRGRLQQVDSESFRIADQFREVLRHLNVSLYRYGGNHDPADLEKFFNASVELGRWLENQTPKLTTQEEKALLQQLHSAYDQYLRVATDLQARLKALGTQGAGILDYAGLMTESKHLFDLGQALSKAHYQSRGIALAEANQSITGLRRLVLISLAGLFLFGLALAWGVYREMIAPLRTQLLESWNVAERQEKLASLGLLAAGVAHEIRNPLTAIKAALFVQQKRLLPGTSEFGDAQIVERELLRLERIVNGFLLFARPNEPQLAVLPADAPLREVHRLLGPQLSKDQIQLVLEKSPALSIQADTAQVGQVLINLVQNAAEAVGRDGKVILRVRKDRKRLPGGETEVAILEVTDNGKGIAPDVQKRMFDPFFTTKETGTGLGLSIAAGIIQKHGGTLQYQTQMHRGTTFGIVLPLCVP